MSWRETLGLAKAACALHAHNPHNAQKPRGQGNSADSADSASADAKDTASTLLDALSDACRELPITPATVRDALAPADIEDWRKGGITSDTLTAFARSLVQRRTMDQGQRPAHYTEPATCKRCGPIWLWFSGDVLGCPWCWNRVAGRPIPRPGQIQNQDQGRRND